MEVGVESPENSRGSGIAMEFPASDGATACSPPVMPPRLRRRLSETRTMSPSSVEEIEAKLRGADLRRQKFYEYLSSKARPKPRSPSLSSCHEEDPGQRLEAKLHAAEQKRLSILAKAQMRLAKLDELRQAAKTGVELRFKKECAELGTKVESRVRKAEVNRMLILKAYRQRRAIERERISQSLLRRMARESKYKELVHAAICQKRVAAEKKRLALLEAEKKKARARVLQVRKVAKSVSCQREIERRRMKDKLEDRLQRAKRKRAEYLMQRGRNYNSVIWIQMHDQADFLSRKLARCWRRFLKLKKTTSHLAKAYDNLNINERCIKSLPFEQLARLIESANTLQTTKALLDRLESRYKVSKDVAATTRPSSWDDIDHLLKRVASPNRRATPRKSMRSRDTKKPVSTRQAVESSVKLSRYQVRIVLCAYMILSHPDAVFSGQGDRELALAKSAEKFVQEFELLVKIILDGPVHSSDEEFEAASTKRWTFRSQLAAFDAAWCSYLNSFVMWKIKDAQSLEEDLVRAAWHLELSMIQTCKLTPEGESGALTHDMKAIQKQLRQVSEDQKLLREKVHHLSGEAGIERMECALTDMRRKYFQLIENGGSPGSPITHILSPSTSNFSDSPSPFVLSEKSSDVGGSSKKPGVVRSLFKEDAASPSKEVGSSALSSSLDAQLHSSGEKFNMENELIVNAIVHGEHHVFSESSGHTDELQSDIKALVRETMEKAFWDGIMDSLKQDEPNYNQVIELMKEVRDEICEMAPTSWKQEIMDSVDVDILSQVLNSGNLDMDYLGNIMEFALNTLQKLSAPANEDDLKVNHQKLLKELAEIGQSKEWSTHSHLIALIRGLRFVLEQIQALKQEISKARIRILEPLLKGPAGLDYLRKAFTNRYGPPSDASYALPLTMRWLSSVCDIKDQEWEEHKKALSELTIVPGNPSQRPLPSTLRSGGSLPVRSSSSTASATSTTGADNENLECEGEKIDLLVRLGLLKLVTRTSGLTQEELPETLKLNLLRLRAVQASVQKIIVIATSILVLWQTVVTEQSISSPPSMENMISPCIKQLSDLLDSNQDAGITEIVEILVKVSATKKPESTKEVMSRMLTKSLQAEDPIFVRVSRAVYLALRGVVLGGESGRALAEMALRQVGAALLTDRVVEAAEAVVVASRVSGNVHREWYMHM